MHFALKVFSRKKNYPQEILLCSLTVCDEVKRKQRKYHPKLLGLLCRAVVSTVKQFALV